MKKKEKTGGREKTAGQEKTTKNRRKRALIGIVASVFVLLLALMIAFDFVLPVTYSVDESQIRKNENYNVKVVSSGEFTALAKVNPDGTYSDEDFKVMAFTDMHLDHYKERGDYSINLMIRAIVNEQPDLVIFDGDIITSSFNNHRARQLCRVMEELGVYWAYALGNHEHDNNFSISRTLMMRIFASYDHCLVDPKAKKTSAGEKVDGVGNYVINLLNAEGKVRESLFIMDGGQKMAKSDFARYYGTEFTDADLDYDYVKDSQITWYREALTKIREKNGADVPSSLFIHIPLVEYADAYNTYTGETEVSPMNRYEYPLGTDADNQLISGLRRETVNSSGHNSGLFDMLLSEGSTKLVVAGHDHINDFILNYKGITLAYCETSGYSSYNVLSKKVVLEGEGLIQGYSIYTYDRDGGFTIETKHNADMDYYSEYEEGLMGVIRK